MRRDLFSSASACRGYHKSAPRARPALRATAAGAPPATAVVACFLPSPVLLLLTPGRRAGNAGVKPQARQAVRGTGYLTPADQRKAARHLTSTASQASAGRGQHEPGSRACSPTMSRRGRKTMPVVAYYLGRPAGVWIAAMSGSAQATAANPAAVNSRCPRRAGELVARRRTLEESSAPAATAVSTSPGKAGPATSSPPSIPHHQPG
jgi:hypothetical protein